MALAQKDEALRLPPMEKGQEPEGETAFASPVARSEEDHLRRVFGEQGVPPAPKFDFLREWKMCIAKDPSTEEFV
eukprot:Skav235609  [mRNA]  locus=scaffold358:1655:4069:+ [translate_table: standard]